MKNKVIDAALIILTLGLAALCFYFIYAEFMPDDAVVKSICFAVIILFFYITSPLHELGHMLFGALVKIKAVPKITINFFKPSQCKIIPKTDKNLKGRMIFTTLGGLFVNFIFIVLGVIALAVPQVPVYLCVGMPASFYLFALNVLPIETGTGKTDGLILQELIRGEDAAKVMLAVLTVQAQILGGKPVKEVEEALLFSLPQIREDDPAFISLTELRYEYLKAKEDPSAEQYLTRLNQLKKDYM